MDNTVNKENKILYACKSCGGGMKFDINKQKLTCEYCGSEEADIDVNRSIQEYDLENHLYEDDGHDWTSEVKIIKCESCGAEIIMNDEETSTQCSFCESNHLITEHEQDAIRPEAILPFKVDSHKAANILEDWIKKQYFAPSNLKKVYKSDKMKPIYVPYWTFDARTKSSYYGKGGKVYYETKVVDGKEKKVEKVNWKPVSGEIDKFFDDIQVNASKNFSEDMMNKVEPFTMSELLPYDKKYLSGYVAERYTKSLDDCFNIAKKEMERDLREEGRKDILKRYDKAKIENLYVDHNECKFKHILIPVWSAFYEYKGKKYQYIINGETGKINGKVPPSILKLALLAIVILGIAWMIYGGK